MGDAIRSQLQPVRRRQQLSWVLRSVANGLLVGGCLALLIAVARVIALRSGVPTDSNPASVWLPIWLPIGVVGAGLLCGLGAGLLRRRGFSAAAGAVDRHYRLRDRATTALAFLGDPAATDPVHSLQIEDAARHLKQVDARQVVPVGLPWQMPVAGLVGGVAIALVLLAPGQQRPATAAAAAPDPVIVGEAERLEEEMLKDLEELAERESDNEELQKLVEQIKSLVVEMKEPGVDEREALAKLSEMQAVIAATQSQYNVDAVASELKKVGKAIAPAKAMQAAAAALENGKYDEAAEQLEKFDAKQLEKREAKAVAENLKTLTKQLTEAGQKKLADASKQMADGLEKQNAEDSRKAAEKLAGVCKQQGMRQSIAKGLNLQLARLAECKGACRGTMNGGNRVAKSKTPKSTWGKGASGKPIGSEATKIDTERKRETISGTAGEGPSEREVTQSPDGRQDATRKYREKFDEYRRQSEAVLESESLPLGQRQMIRRYFERIRPDNTEAEQVDKPAMSE